MGTAEFYLEVENKRLKVEGKIPYRPGFGVPEIVLNRNAVVCEMQLNDRRDFRKRAYGQNEYFVSYYFNAEEQGTIHILYDTPIEGWDNCISDDLIAISLYSHAFPTYLPRYINDSICFLKRGFEGDEVYEAYLDKITGLYAKKTKKCLEKLSILLACQRKKSGCTSRARYELYT